MRSTDLNDRFEALCLAGEFTMKLSESGQEHISCRCTNGNVHCRGESVIGALRHVHMIIGMDGGFGAQFTSKNFNGPI